jgi:hypothetical protein
VQPILEATDKIVAHRELCSAWCSITIRTARSRTSAENRFDPINPILSQVGVSGKAGAVHPVSDLAALAKSLVELQSLKERVTRDSESVGGPIDVAVISKHDGFVWIERKHYFRPELNPRFFSRIKSEKRL